MSKKPFVRPAVIAGSTCGFGIAFSSFLVFDPAPAIAGSADSVDGGGTAR